MLLHIIHPYTYLDSLNEKRDLAVFELYAAFREHGQKTLLTWHAPHGSKDHLATFAGLQEHPPLSSVLTAHYNIYTPSTGRPPVREIGMSECRWQELSLQYTSIDDVLSLTRAHPTHILAGGYFERCVLDTALFLREYQPRATIFVVPELCVTKRNAKEAKSRMFAHKIVCISARDADRLVS